MADLVDAHYRPSQVEWWQSGGRGPTSYFGEAEVVLDLDGSMT